MTGLIWSILPSACVRAGRERRVVATEICRAQTRAARSIARPPVVMVCRILAQAEPVACSRAPGLAFAPSALCSGGSNDRIRSCRASRDAARCHHARHVHAETCARRRQPARHQSGDDGARPHASDGLGSLQRLPEPSKWRSAAEGRAVARLVGDLHARSARPLLRHRSGQEPGAAREAHARVRQALPRQARSGQEQDRVRSAQQLCAAGPSALAHRAVSARVRRRRPARRI